ATTGFAHVTPPSVERLTSSMCPLPPASMPRPSASQTLSCGSKATDGSLMRGHGPPEVTVVPGSPPVVHVRPPVCDDEKTRLLAPPPLNQRPDCVSATIVWPKANESGSSCVLC